MSSDFHAGSPKRQPTYHPEPPRPEHRAPARPALPHQGREATAAGLGHFNAAPVRAAEAALLACCGSRRWAQRLVEHRPYPDLDSLLAAADEAAYDLSVDEVGEALADEYSTGLREGAPASAQTALRAAHAAYESSFGHAFVISLDGLRPEEHLNQVLAGIRSRLGNEPDEERSVAADELRRLARGRLAHLVANHLELGDSPVSSCIAGS